MTTPTPDPDEVAREIASTIGQYAEFWCEECSAFGEHCACDENVRERAARPMQTVIASALRAERARAGWQPIETHPRDEKDCLLAVFVDGSLYVADRGGWVEGDTREEWDEVEDGISVKIWEDQDEGHWSSNHQVIDEPTHWMPLPPAGGENE